MTEKQSEPELSTLQRGARDGIIPASALRELVASGALTEADLPRPIHLKLEK